MFIAGLLRWWYSAGYVGCAKGCMVRLESAMDYFSIGLLLRTMFSLFRQDGAGGSGGSISMKMQRFLGRLISRFIGAGVRFVVLVVGLVTITIIAVGSLISLIIWAIVPILPFIGLILTLSGWVPWHI